MRSGPVNSTLTRGYGTLGGLGIIGAAFFAVPSTLLLQPQPPAEAYLCTIAALTTGLVCMGLPWERLDPRWLHLFGVLATVEAAWAVAVFGPAYMAFFFLIAVSVAYVTPDARRLIPHLLLIGLALFGPVAYGPESPREALQMALVVYPLLVLTAGIFAYLRQRMVADHRSYRLFAEETLALADRIAGRSLTLQRSVPSGGADDLPAWSRFRVSGRAAAFAAAILATPLVTAGLAAAGVKLPGFAANTFADVGIDLPNQGEAQEATAAAILKKVARPVAESTSGGRSNDPQGSGESGVASGSGRDDAQPEEGGAETTNEVVEGTAGAGEEPVASVSPQSQGSESPGEAPGGDISGAQGGQSDTLSQTLENTVSGLGGLLGLQDRDNTSPPAAETSAE